MVDYLNEIGTDGHIDNPNSVKTSCQLSSHVVIKSGGHPIGALQHFAFRENVDANGNRQIQGDCSRILFDKVGIIELLYNSKDKHIVPGKKFTIEIHQKAMNSITRLGNVELTHYSTCFYANDFIIRECVCFTAETISSVTME